MHLTQPFLLFLLLTTHVPCGSFLQGLGATILRNTPANAVYLGTFEVLKGAAAQQLGCKVRTWAAYLGIKNAPEPCHRRAHTLELQHVLPQHMQGVLPAQAMHVPFEAHNLGRSELVALCCDAVLSPPEQC